MNIKKNVNNDQAENSISLKDKKNDQQSSTLKEEKKGSVMTDVELETEGNRMKQKQKGINCELSY
ncbi:MAG: hypothetical protein H0V14_04260 [Chitinophagaceae bacterium]|nr:hypothetical protein [Chitinophagaceae bacterium]